MPASVIMSTNPASVTMVTNLDVRESLVASIRRHLYESINDWKKSLNKYSDDLTKAEQITPPTDALKRITVSLF